MQPEEPKTNGSYHKMVDPQHNTLAQLMGSLVESPNVASPSGNSYKGVVGYLTDAMTPKFEPNILNLEPVRSPGCEALRDSTERWEKWNELRSDSKSLMAAANIGSQRGSIVTLVSTALGSGVLTIPYAFSLTGIGLGVCTMLLAYVANSLSQPICLLASRYTGCTSYAELVALAAQRRWVTLLLDAAIFCFGFGVGMAAFIFEGDFLVSIFSAFPSTAFITREMCIIGIGLLAWPLCLPSDVSLLRYFAAMSPFVIVITIIAVILQMPAKIGEQTNFAFDVQFWTFEPISWLKAATMCVFAFNSQINAVAVGNQLEKPSTRRIVKVTTYANSIALLLYVAIGTAGYLSYTSVVQGDFLNNYPSDSILMLCIRCLLSFNILVNMALAFVPTCRSLENFILGCGGLVADANWVPWPVSKLLVTVTLAACLQASLKVQDAAAVLSVLGGSLSALLMFWLPALIYYNILYPMQTKVFRTVVLAVLLMMGFCCFLSVGVQFFWH